MPERTAAEVLAEKLEAVLLETMDRSERESYACILHLRRAAERLAEDPAIAVRTDMVVERFIVEFHCTDWYNQKPLSADEIHRNLTTSSHFVESARHRIIVRPYPEDPDA